MNRIRFIIALTLVPITWVYTGCKRYAEDPKLVLRNPAQRLKGEWKRNKILMDGNDSSQWIKERSLFEITYDFNIKDKTITYRKNGNIINETPPQLSDFFFNDDQTKLAFFPELIFNGNDFTSVIPARYETRNFDGADILKLTHREMHISYNVIDFTTKMAHKVDMIFTHL